MAVVARAHDLLVNTDMGDMKQPEWMVRVKEDYFKAGESMFTSRELAELLDEMDRMGVERAVLMTNLPNPSKRVLSFVDAHPDRFSLGARRPRPAAPDGEPPQRSRASSPTTRSRTRSSARASGATACTRRATRCTSRSTRSAASSSCRCA